MKNFIINVTIGLLGIIITLSLMFAFFAFMAAWPLQTSLVLLIMGIIGAAYWIGWLSRTLTQH